MTYDEEEKIEQVANKIMNYPLIENIERIQSNCMFNQIIESPKKANTPLDLTHDWTSESKTPTGKGMPYLRSSGSKVKLPLSKVRNYRNSLIDKDNIIDHKGDQTMKSK